MVNNGQDNTSDSMVREETRRKRVVWRSVVLPVNVNKRRMHNKLYLASSYVTT
jgi:hypothetical protein